MKNKGEREIFSFMFLMTFFKRGSVFKLKERPFFSHEQVMSLNKEVSSIVFSFML